jgi:hypothetical protein
MIETTNRPFPEVFADLRPSPGVTFRPLAEHTRRLDLADEGLSQSDHARRSSNDEPLDPHAIDQVAAALDEIGRPRCFVEYRVPPLRQSLDRQSGDPS